MTLPLSLAALAVTVLVVALLGRADPKRLRLAGRPEAMGAGPRRMLAALAALPGLALAGFGLWPAFLIGLGGCAVLGWAIANAFAGGGRAGR